MLEIGSVIDGKYKILHKIGQGGMSIVYLALNERANQQWAIKEVRKDGAQDFEVVKQGLIAEIDILKKLKHPHLPRIIDVIDGDETFLIVMDFVEGCALDKELKNGPIPQEMVIDWAIQLCDVLGYLHSRKPPIIYRDMKPSNVMKKPDGNLMLIDFGTAREFKGGKAEDTVCLGTRGYAAPEQYGNKGETDARTDIYCLGATLYHLVTGHNPSEEPYQMYPIRYWNPALSAGLEEIILKCTRQNPEERYQSCAELMYDLEHYSEKDGEYRKKLRRKLYAFAGLAAAATICAGTALGFHVAANAEQRNTYDVYLKNAQIGKNMDTKEENYLKAIEIDPSQAQPYLELLSDVYLADNNYEYSNPAGSAASERTEAQKMDELISVFTGTQYDLAEIRYRVGIATYYYADGNGNKQGSYKYFDDVLGNDGIGNLDPNDPASQQKLKRAECLRNIADYYGKLFIQDKSGDNVASFEKYWEDMKETIKGDLVEEDNYKTALVVYKEFVTTIREEVSNFKQSNVTKGDLQAQLENITTHLDEDFADVMLTANAAVQEEISLESQNIKTIIEQARSRIELAFAE